MTLTPPIVHKLIEITSELEFGTLCVLMSPLYVHTKFIAFALNCDSGQYPTMALYQLCRWHITVANAPAGRTPSIIAKWEIYGSILLNLFNCSLK